MKKLLNVSVILILLSALTACSTPSVSISSDAEMTTREKMNRKAFRFNQKLDKKVVNPVVRTYQKVTPDVVETGIGNFFANLGDLSNAFNNVLQFKLVDAGSDMTRFAFNSTFGLAGLIDVASALQLEKHDEDFGQTLAHWGIKSGSYTVTPFLGASTTRDSIGFWVDMASNPLSYMEDSTGLSVLESLNTRAESLEETSKPSIAGTDEYAIARDKWLKKRAEQIQQ
jgi:phospholipid-binding lipoprotein MlaA